MVRKLCTNRGQWSPSGAVHCSNCPNVAEGMSLIRDLGRRVNLSPTMPQGAVRTAHACWCVCRGEPEDLSSLQGSLAIGRPSAADGRRSCMRLMHEDRAASSANSMICTSAGSPSTPLTVALRHLRPGCGPTQTLGRGKSSSRRGWPATGSVRVRRDVSDELSVDAKMCVRDDGDVSAAPDRAAQLEGRHARDGS